MFGTPFFLLAIFGFRTKNQFGRALVAGPWVLYNFGMSGGQVDFYVFGLP